ncbi:MAG: hypothetical protein ACR2HD_03885 [Solirubrobacteraceae bacterium]|nr:MAG: hypothetical protein DLM63_06845 [Solirubrobacterales bacterium]
MAGKTLARSCAVAVTIASAGLIAPGDHARAAAPPVAAAGAAVPVAALRMDVGHPNPVAHHAWTLVVRVHNTGSTTLAPQGLLAITAKGAAAPLQQQLLLYPQVAPGHRFNGRVRLGGLARGSYELDVKLGAAGAFLDHVRVVFATRAPEAGAGIAGYLLYLLAAIAAVGAVLFARRSLANRRSLKPPPSTHDRSRGDPG